MLRYRFCLAFRQSFILHYFVYCQILSNLFMSLNDSILFYYPGDNNCQKILLLIEYLKISIKKEPINVESMDHYSDQFRLRSPQTSIPLFKTSSNNIILTETPSILTFLASAYGEKYNTLYPLNDVLVQTKINQCLEFDFNVLQHLIDEYFYSTLLDSEPRNKLKFDELRQAIVWLNGYLKGRKYVASNQLSVADVALVVTICQIKAFGLNTTSYTMLNDWYERCKLSLAQSNFREIVENYANKIADRYANKIKNM